MVADKIPAYGENFLIEPVMSKWYVLMEHYSNDYDVSKSYLHVFHNLGHFRNVFLETFEKEFQLSDYTKNLIFPERNEKKFRYLMMSDHQIDVFYSVVNICTLKDGTRSVMLHYCRNLVDQRWGHLHNKILEWFAEQVGAVRIILFASIGLDSYWVKQGF